MEKLYPCKNHSPWLAIMRLDDWIEIYKEWEVEVASKNLT
jgi:hypothetical protein